MAPTPMEDRIRPALERMLRQIHFWNYVDALGWRVWTGRIQEPSGLDVWAASDSLDGVVEELREAVK